MGNKAVLAALIDHMAAELPLAADVRRQIHADPQLGGNEDSTADLVLDALGATDTAAVTEGRIARFDIGSGPAVAIRGELDALPIQEATNVEWRSQNGAMHACGHDVHLAALVAVARTLARVGGPAPLVAVLQPREETVPSGAKDMVAATELLRHNIGAFIGAHVQPSLKPGVIACQSGPVNAAADEFAITIHGQPGHGAYPHRARDSVVAAAAVVAALNQLTARRIDPMQPSVITVGSISGGSAPNAICTQVRLTGTVRSYDTESRALLQRLIRESSEHTAQAYGCDAEIEMKVGEPVLINNHALAETARPLLASVGFDPDGDHRSCGADDFAYYCEAFPSLMCFVGVDAPSGVDLHHPQFLPPEEAIAHVATAMMAGYVAATEVFAASQEGNPDGTLRH